MARSRAAVALRDVAGDLAAIPRRSLIDCAKAVKLVALDEARRQTGDGRMSGIGKRGAKLRAVDEITETGRGNVVCTVKGVPAGGWSMLTDGAGPHEIGPRRKRASDGGPPVMVSADMRHAVVGRVQHRGMRGRDAWRNVTRQAVPEVVRIVGDAVHVAVH